MLKRAIRSVLAQNYRDFRVCIYDNDSGDETAAVVTQLAREDRRVDYYCHASNIGAWNNFKYGIDQVRTPYFNLLSDDDALLPGFFETAIDALESQKEAGLFAGATVRFSRGFIAAPVVRWPRRFFPAPLGFLEILRRDFPDWNAIVFRQSMLDRVGGIDVSFEHAIDLDFICRYSVNCGMIVCPVPYAVLTIGHDHLSKQLYSPATHAGHWLRILDRYEFAPWINDEACEGFACARAWIGRKIFKNAIDAAASSRNEQALAAAACLKESFAMSKAPLLLGLMTADTALGEALRGIYRSLHSSVRVIRSPIRRYLHKQDIRSVTAALAL
jgi:glycosyltransferase involved in cell wall biosynthesis